jgi:hypothetical protein
MSEYQLVFNGKLSEGHEINQVKSNLASLFKTNKMKIEQMFASLPIVVKRNVDYNGALIYQKVLHKAGAICQVEETTKFIELPAPGKTQQPPLTYKPDLAASDVDYIPDALPYSATAKTSSKEGIKGFGDILSGVVLIGIGFVVGGSVFMGEAAWLDYLFDGLGVFWIGRGIYKMIRSVS